MRGVECHGRATNEKDVREKGRGEKVREGITDRGDDGDDKDGHTLQD